MLDLALDVSLRSFAAAAAVGLVLAALRVRSGAARHAAWSAVLLTMMTMPALRMVPRVDVPVPAGVASGFETIAGDASPFLRQDAPPLQKTGGQLPAVVASGPALDVRQTPAHAVIDTRFAMTALYAAGVLIVL